MVVDDEASDRRSVVCFMAVTEISLSITDEVSVTTVSPAAKVATGDMEAMRPNMCFRINMVQSYCKK